MNFSIDTEYSLWLIIPGIIVAFLYAYLLYRKDPRFEDLSSMRIKLMSALRFLVVFVLILLLLNPLINKMTKQIEKPVIIFAQDNSSSILINKDSLFYKDKYINNINNK